MKLFAAMVATSMLGMLAVAPAAAQQTAGQGVRPREALAQSQSKRPRTRLRVGPRYPYRQYHSLYPLPYDVEFPGPNAKRECVARYVTEHRPSGTVIAPRMRCRWVRG